VVFVFEGPGIERTCSRPRQRPDPLGRVQCLGTASRRDARARTRRVPLENRPATVRQARRPTRVNGPRQDPATVEARAFSRKTTKPGFARGPLGVHEAVISGHRESPSVRGFGGTERPGVTDDGMARQPPITRNEGVPGSSPGVGFFGFAGKRTFSFISLRSACWNTSLQMRVPTPRRLCSEPASAVFAPGDGLGPYRRLLEGSEYRLTERRTLLIQFRGRVLEAARFEVDNLLADLEEQALAA
jgi:hypothetical protein